MDFYDKNAMRQDADLETVAQAIGLRTIRRGMRTFIECPNPEHSSEHTPGKSLTNCYIGHDSASGEEYFICKSCGCHGDVFDMVRTYEGIGFREACQEIGDIIAGSSDAYLLKKEERKRQLEAYEEKKKLPTYEELRLIGIGSERVYSKYCPIQRELSGSYDLPEGFEVINQGKGLWAGKLLDPNPLLHLMKEDEEAFDWLILSRTESALEYWNNLLDLGKMEPKKEHMTKEIIQMLTFPVYQDVVMTTIRKLEDLYIRYGGVLKHKNTFKHIA